MILQRETEWPAIAKSSGSGTSFARSTARVSASRWRSSPRPEQVHQRTIRRDLDALCASGFPLRDEKINGSTVWKLETSRSGRWKQTGLGLIELCALYFSRTLLTTMAGAPLGEDAERAFVKIEKALPVSCRKFLDNLPVLLKARVAGRKKQDDKKVREHMTRALDASLTHRRITMRYHSHASARTRDYVVEPLRIAYADGGIYLTGWVPEYGELRTFAAERIKTLAVMDEHFEPRPLPAEPFANSLGVHTGAAERVEIELDAQTADYVSSREWHESQTFETRADGTVLMRLDVSIDRPLRRWILGFGADARVVAPAHLAQEMLRRDGAGASALHAAVRVRDGQDVDGLES